MNALRDWFRRHLSNPQVVALAVVVVVLVVVIWAFGHMLAPLLAALVIAYLLDSLASRLRQRGVPHLAAVLAVFLGFVALLLVAVLWLFPLLARQLSQLFQQAPSMLAKAQQALLQLPTQYPALVSEEQVRDLLSGLSSEVVTLGQAILSLSFSSVVTMITIGVYLVLVPILVFFLLKDKAMISSWGQTFLPRDRQLTDQVWGEVDKQLGNYVRGKFVEILIVGLAMWIVFRLLGLQYAVLLATITGLSVLIPYVGATVVTIPVALVAYFQFGLEAGFYYALLGYGIIQFLDGNLLVPLLFSEVVDLHPVAIITAILFFGGIWGFWGVFFAIPLATAIQAILRAWPASHPAQAAAPPS
ncbi:MAG: AI-2E family transporter [Gammaproteobacteria bacterium]